MVGLTEEESNTLSLLKSISRYDEKTITDVLKSLVMATTISAYREDNKLVIPYLCSISFDYFDKYTKDGTITVVELEAEPSKNLIREISAISAGEKTPTFKYIKNNIDKKYQTLLGV